MITTGFDLLKRDKGLLFRNNPFSVPCILSNGTETQGKNSLLDPTDLNYDSTDVLKCIGNYNGIQLNTENKTSIINDSAEATLNIDDVVYNLLSLICNIKSYLALQTISSNNLHHIANLYKTSSWLNILIKMSQKQIFS